MIERAEIERAIERNKMIKKLISEIGMIKARLRASDPLVPVVEPQRYEEYELLESILTAELSRQENAPLTWNDRINQMTLNERAFLSAGFGYIVERSRKWAASKYKFKPWKIQGAMEEYMRKFLNSPYTEGEKA